MEMIGWIVPIAFICVLIIGFIGHIGYQEDHNNKIEECESNGGELTTGKTNGCLINNTLHEMTRTKNGWIVLDAQGQEKEHE